MKPYYEHNGITIYHGDCREILPQLHRENAGLITDSPIPAYDMILADPPYGLNHASGFESTWRGDAIQNDHSLELRDWIIANSRVNAVVIFGSWKVARPKCRQILIWDKGPNSGMGDLSFPWKNSFEEIYVIGDAFEGSRDESVLKGFRAFTWESGPGHNGANGRQHPNEKPIPLLKYLIGKSCGEIVCDPVMGSGTTLRAAKEIGRRAIGIEIEEKYCEIAAKRLSQEVFQF